ncbi:hypothetical protein HYH02_002568 [Chlamydomonas schloesseri]|uniref:Ankyrin repeat domain-containing protein n=1 Tax=Chlamydomonas schloesseri TaxID=2026947 RepID=A0A836BBU0_9CHLO|nr:hypothetical protein HYH02_002568 [Chlamydomonas schloesseri]|eukprot:KAG2453245.1 hypothetical protein HYH02_002568 [Chlamydomonas schloesseri]
MAQKATISSAPAGWNSLTPELVRKIASFAHPNDCAASLKLLNSETAAALRDTYKGFTLGVSKQDWSEPHRAVQPWPGQLFVAHWGRPEPWHALTLPQRERLLCLAASSGHVPSLEAALVHSGCALKPDVLTAAAASGSLLCCARLLGEGCSCSEACFAVAAEAGHLPALELLLEAVRSSRLKPESVTAAAMGACRGGRLDLVSWLQHEHGYSPRYLDLVRLAAASGKAAAFEALLPMCPQLALVAEPGLEQPERRVSGYGWQLGQHPQAEEAARREEQRQRQVRWDVLQALVQGCPVEVLQRHYDRLWRWRWQRAAAAPSAAAAAVAAVAAGAVAGGPAASSNSSSSSRNEVEGEFAAEDGHRDLALGRLLGAAIASPTPCWAAKVDFLLSAWGPTVAGQVLRGERGQRDTWACVVSSLQPEPALDLLPRLQRLRSLGAVLDAGTAARLARGGHAETLAWLWDDECGVAPSDVDLGGRQLTQVFATRGGAGGRLALLQLLQDRGAAVYGASHVASEAVHLPSEPALCWLAEQVPAAPPPERGGYSSDDNECWSRAFAAAARKGASLDTLQLLRRRGASTHLAMAAAGGSLAVMEWVAVERVAETDGRQLLPLHRTDVRAVIDSGNAATLEWLWRRGLVRPATLPSLAHVCGELAPHRFWRLQLWTRVQLLPAAAGSAATAATIAAEQSLQSAVAAASGSAVASAATSCVAALWTAVREELGYAAKERAQGREEDCGDSSRPARYEDTLMLPHQLAWFERESCTRAVGALAVEG